MRDSFARHARALLPCLWFLLLCALLVGCAGLPGSSGNTSASASRLRIASSPALLPLLSAAVALFERQHSGAQIAVQRDESIDGLSALAHQQVAIASTVLYANPSAAFAAHLRDELFGVVPYVIVVQHAAPQASLSQGQIQRIFSTGLITDWRQIDGPKQKLVVVLPPLTSDTAILFREEMLGGAAELGNALSADSLETLRDMVARTPGSIGYLPAPWLNAGVHAVGIDGEAATAEQIASGTYGFWAFAHLYTWDTSQHETEETTLFLQFMQSSAVAQLALQLGYIPLSEMHAASVSI